MTVGQVAAMIGGKVEGDPEKGISGFSPIEEAGPGALTFLSNPKYNHYLYTTNAAAVLVGEDFVPEKEYSPVLIRVADVYTTLSALLEKFGSSGITKTGREEPSYVAATATVGRETYIGAFAYIGENSKLKDGAKIFPQAYVGDNVVIGENTVVYPGVKIYANSVIGRNCILHSGCIIGSDGFGFAPQADGTYKKVPQTDNVILGNNVEVGANTTIDRATMKSTILADGVKIDNLVQIAHNVELGDNTVVASQTGISGSTKIGAGVVIGGQAGIVGHINIADGSIIAARAGISKTISEPKKKWFGYVAEEYGQSIKAQVIYRRLPQLLDELNKLKAEVKKLKSDDSNEY